MSIYNRVKKIATANNLTLHKFIENAWMQYNPELHKHDVLRTLRTLEMDTYTEENMPPWLLKYTRLQEHLHIYQVDYNMCPKQCAMMDTTKSGDLKCPACSTTVKKHDKSMSKPESSTQCNDGTDDYGDDDEVVKNGLYPA